MSKADEIERYENKDRENHVKQEGYDAGFFNGREVALEKAQNAIDKVILSTAHGGLSDIELNRMFGFSNLYRIFTENTLREIIEKFDKAESVSEEELVKNISKEEAKKLMWDEVRDLGYKEGLEKAWEVVKRIVLLPTDGGVPSDESKKIFGTASLYAIFKRGMTIYDVIEELDKYDERNEIYVGDEVILDNNGEKAVVTEICTNTLYVNVMHSDGCTRCRTINSIKKTGNHFSEVGKLLEALRGEETE